MGGGSAGGDQTEATLELLLGGSDRPGSMPPQRRYGSPAVFLFVMGLEGTGHHLFQKVYKKSPSFKRLSGWGFVQDGKYGQIMGSLWNQRNPASGVWNAHCSIFAAPDNSKGRGRDGNGNRPEMDQANGTELVLRLAKSLREMDTAIRLNHMPLRDGDKTVVALSAVTVKRGNRAPGQGMISYPNLKGQCRFIDYPDINILYDACDRAEVDCSHIVIHRDAHSVIRSTVLRRHFSEMPVQIKLYTTLLNVIHSQIFDHPERLASCWDYSVGAEGVNSGDGGGIAAMGRLLGWSEVEFREFYGQIYNVSAPMNDTTKEEIVGDAMRPFMGAMVRASDRVKNSCRKIFDVYHPLTEKKLENASGKIHISN